MKRKLLSLLMLLMTATGAWAETITWDNTNVFKRENAGVFITRDNMQGSAVTSTSASATYEGITISCDKSDGSHLMLCSPYGPEAGRLILRGASGDSFTFTAPTGKIFTKIEIYGYVGTFTPYGDWTQPSEIQIAWSGTAANTVTLGSVNISLPEVERIVFYLADVAVTAKEGASGEYWATYYNGTTSFTADENTTVFQAALSGSSLTLTEVPNREIPATKAVILKSSSATITLTPATTTATLEGNQLKGTTAEMTGAAGNIYVLNKKSDVVGFYKLSSGGKIGANKAYLTYSSGAAPSFFGFDETTGIDATLVNSEKVNSVVYDLQGRRVAQPTKGLYIVNGKKVVIK